MEKRVVFLTLALLLILTVLPFLHAQIDPLEEQEKINNAYQCLEDKVEETTCSSLSTEEKIFTLLAIDECQAEVLADSQNDGECWPAGNCNAKTTAQAILALDNTNANTDKAETWLLSQNKTTTELSWFLEIENSEPTTCSIEYAGLSFTVNIGADKKLSNNAGSCLVLAQDDNWLRISPSCFDEEFQVSCDQSFLTTLLFQKINSPTIHVLQTSSSAASGGTTTEKAESTCFSQGGGCNYEETLWASLVLDSLGKDVNAHLPYLTTLAEDNQRFIPEAFLYFITSDIEHRTSVLAKQKSSKWWEESGDKFYDTPVALYPFQQETVEEKLNSKEWLLDVQDENSCWENNVRNTAFILASIWPRDFTSSGGGGEGLASCEDAGHFCTSAGSCPDGNLLSEFDCPALFRCCNTAPVQETCSEQGGTICSSSQVCSGGNEISTADLAIGEACCVRGFCQTSTPTQEEPTECELNNGVCRSFGCNVEEEESFLSCDFGGDSCCIQESFGEGSSGGGSFLVWFFVILIVLVIVGIIFRERLRMLLFRMKSGFGRGSPRGPRHRPGPPGRPSYPPRRTAIPERKILLPSSKPSPRPPSGKSRAQKELDDVLKKLKDMSK